MKKVKYAAIYMLSMAALFMHTGCAAMLPVEEEVLRPPIIRAAASREYTQTFVERGDMLQIRRVRLSYIPAKEEDYIFTVGDELISAVYVDKGDLVKKGDLLVELERSTFEANIRSIANDIARLELDKRHIAESKGLDLKHAQARLTNLKEELALALSLPAEEQDAGKISGIRSQINSAAAAPASIASGYDAQLENVLTQLEVASLKLAEATLQNEKRVIRAGMDGTITYVKSSKEGDRSVENERFITLTDKSTSVFTASEQDSQYFNIGEIYTLTFEANEYEAEAVTPESLGLEQQSEDSTAAQKAYFKMLESVSEIKEGSHAEIAIVTGSRENVLFIDQKAIKTSNGQKIVYLLEDEVRVMKVIETGFEANGVVEVLAGLDEGQSIILD